ncbi:YihY/virulence factor BrkB family protein [Guyparkeria sp. GHLCS8-2]|uniref:YihY/virulence factor BrkB family protein n=1 Tax=Guyparkeria halopsychrophila TaxID=3139421 RepID=UPI0037CB74D7
MRKLWLKVKQSTAWRVLFCAHARWVEADGNDGAAAFAYYLLLSFLPLVILLVTVGSLFVERDVATQAVVQWVKHYVPLTGEQEHSAVGSIGGMLGARGQISLVAIPLLFWSSLQFLSVLIRITNRLWQSPSFSWWRLPLKSLSLLGITVSAVLIGILVPGVARMSHEWLATRLGLPDWLFVMIFHLIPWLVLFYGLIMIYRLAPSRVTRFSEVWLGALIATLLIWIGEWLFLLYGTHFTSFNAIYGALGGIVAFLIWIYFSSYVCLFGICFCAVRAEEVQAKAEDPLQPTSG